MVRLRRANKGCSKFASPAARRLHTKPPNLVCQRRAPTKPQNLFRLSRANNVLNNLVRLRRANKGSKFASPVARQRLEILFACGAPTRKGSKLLRLGRASNASKYISPAAQNVFRLRRANKVSNFILPAARQQGLKICFACGAPTPHGLEISFCSSHACGAPKKPLDSVRLRRANKASNESLFRLRRTYKLHRTRTRILLRLRRANIASNTIVLRLRRANKEGLKICFACGAPTIPQKVVRFTCGANKGYQSFFGSVCLQRANTASKFGSDHLWRVNKASKYFCSPAAH